MPPSEDALLLLRIVERHLRSLRFGLDEEFPAEDWGFTAQQALEKLLKCWIVLANQEPPRSHDLVELAALAEDVLSLTRQAWSELPNSPSLIWRRVAQDAQPLLRYSQ